VHESAPGRREYAARPLTPCTAFVEGNSTLPPKQIEQKAVEIDDHGDGELDRDDQDDQNA